MSKDKAMVPPAATTPTPATPASPEPPKTGEPSPSESVKRRAMLGRTVTWMHAGTEYTGRVIAVQDGAESHFIDAVWVTVFENTRRGRRVFCAAEPDCVIHVGTRKGREVSDVWMHFASLAMLGGMS